MTINTTFGFECEMQEGADRLTASLYQFAQANSAHRMLIGARDLHSYHCDCPACFIQADPTYHLRAQRDSSCSGELISRIYQRAEHAARVTKFIEEHAILTDAVPGWSAGFHVHVAPDRYLDQPQAFFEFLRWEGVLTTLASGRFGFLRDANQHVCYMLANHLEEFAGRAVNAMYDFPRQLELIRRRSDSALYKQELLDRHNRMDRHSTLSTRTRHNTWEFRVFNSTRSAWRMMCWIGIARAFCDPPFIQASQQITAEQLATDPHVALIAALEASGNPDVAALVARQVAYLTKLAAGSVPDDFELLRA